MNLSHRYPCRVSSAWSKSMTMILAVSTSFLILSLSSIFSANAAFIAGLPNTRATHSINKGPISTGSAPSFSLVLSGNNNNHVKSSCSKTTPLLQSSARSDDDGNYDPSNPAIMLESDVAAAANVMAKEMDSIDLPDEISNSFLQYALSIILGRALPDARDGLKPVHRRILYAMSDRGLGLSPSGTHRKCARVVGEVLGKYHPHGDTAVYDALVRLAQPFSTGTPLIDGHGNFGSVDNDPAAAMRYTECKLTKVSHHALLEDLVGVEDTVDFIANFDGNEMEPVVLPARVPVLLLNGCAGIAVGMATNVPPHNLGELMDACGALVKKERMNQNKDEENENNKNHAKNNNNKNKNKHKLSDKELFQLVPGPDFPTGAVLLGNKDAHHMYKTGHGGVTMQAVTHFEETKKGKAGTKGGSKQQRTSIIVTEIPYQVNKAALLEKIAALVNDKKLEGISDLRDESDRDGMRIVIELKRDANAPVVLNNLFKKTTLQTQFSGNFLALMMGSGNNLKPERFTLRSALDCFLEFRFETLRRRAKFLMTKKETRLDIVEGLLVALEHVDQVIDIVRQSPDTNTARDRLVTELKTELTWTAPQIDAVLRLQLGQLTRLNKSKLTKEKESLDESVAELRNLMTEDNAVWEEMLGEFTDIKDKFAVPRRTRIELDETSSNKELSDMDLIENTRSVIVVTKGGYIKRLPLQTFTSQGRGTRGKKSTTATTASTKSSDIEDITTHVSHCFTCNDHDTLLITTHRGVAFGLRAFQIPTAGRTARGVPIPSVLPFKPDDVIASILAVDDFKEDAYCVLATEQGWIKKTPLQAFENLTSRGLIIATLEKGDKLKWFERCTDDNDVLVGSRRGLATRFEASKLRPTGRTSRGVKSMRLREGDSVADMSILKRSKGTDDDAKDNADAEDNAEQFVLVVTKNGYGKRVPTKEFRATARGGVGVIAIKFKPTKNTGKGGDDSNNNVDDITSCIRVVNEDDEVLLTTTKGIIVRQKVGDIPSQGRSATGVTVQKIDVDGGDEISSVSIVPTVEEEDAV